MRRFAKVRPLITMVAVLVGAVIFATHRAMSAYHYLERHVPWPFALVGSLAVWAVAMGIKLYPKRKKQKKQD